MHNIWLGYLTNKIVFYSFFFNMIVTKWIPINIMVMQDYFINYLCGNIYNSVCLYFQLK